MEGYNHIKIENNWCDRWVKDNVCRAEDNSDKPKKYILVEFPYPSGSGLHMGHFLRYTLPEIYSRKLRMDGNNVLFPFGFDAFGLPAENYAIQTGVHPADTTEKCIKVFRDSVQKAGYGIDWEREVTTTDPAYYKWTQWIFLKFFEAGLAELREEPVWWCEKLRTVLANEEVLEDANGNKISERGEYPVEKRNLKQWVLKITEYADKLLEGLNDIDCAEHIKLAQKNWIGKSFGTLIKFELAEKQNEYLEVFTTRADTVFGVTFMAVAPEHEMLEKNKNLIQNYDEVKAYCESAKNKTEIDRQASKEKTGVIIKGLTCRHPFIEGKTIPIFVADYVLTGYGTGAIMAVPAHDERDYEYAKVFELDIIKTIYSKEEKDGGKEEPLPFIIKEEAFVKITDDMKSLFPNDNFVPCEKMIDKLAENLEARGLGKKETMYKMRDWLFSRQRYWGEPIPVIHCKDGKIEAIVSTDDKEGVKKLLPLLLPAIPDYEPTDDGSSPLSRNKEWVKTTDSHGEEASRETNTMPNWAGSCWYYLRYLDPNNDEEFCSQEKMKYWLPVDKYFGGAEHTTRHLLYSRFWHQFLYDKKLVPTKEPYAWRMDGGILLGEDGVKQSKSRGNVVQLVEKLDQYGADALRMYICFLGPYTATMAWNEGGLKACHKLVESIYSLREKVSDKQSSESTVKLFHKTLKSVTEMLDNLKMNTAVSQIMVLVNALKKEENINKDLWKNFIKMIAPMAVFVSEELWQEVNDYKEWKRENSVHLQSWPKYNKELAKEDLITVGVQINGKLRTTISISDNDTENDVKEKVFALDAVKKWTDGKDIKKFIYVSNKIVSITF